MIIYYTIRITKCLMITYLGYKGYSIYKKSLSIKRTSIYKRRINS